MATLSVRVGLNLAARLPSVAVIIVGQNRHLKALKYVEGLHEKLGGEGGLTEQGWARAVELAPATGALPLVFNLAKVLSLPDTASRHNSPSNAYTLYKELRGMTTPPKGINSLSIVLYAERAHVLASVAAVARCFPLYSRKTKSDESPANMDVQLEVVVTDDKALTETDVSFLGSLVDSIRHVGRLVDQPANELHTDAFVEEARALVKDLPGVTEMHIRGDDLAKAGFGGIYNVGKAAVHPPSFLEKTQEALRNFALVGKGIVYDTGGMQIKGKTAMPGMKRDMGGAAGLLCSFVTLVKAGFKHNLHVCLCIAENNISPYANKPDDVIRLLSGKTVEINNTDAEGRLVLADGVFYAKETLKADFILDMCTLTGAQAYASGHQHASILTNLDEWEAKAMIAGRESGDMVHPLPFCPDLHFSDLRSSIADMKNSNLGSMQGPPSEIAGLFIGAQIDFGLTLSRAAPVHDGERATGYGPALVSSLLGRLYTDVPLLNI